MPSHISVDFNIQKNTGKEDYNYEGPSPSLFFSFNDYGNQSNIADCHKTCPLIHLMKSRKVTSFLQKCLTEFLEPYYIYGDQSTEHLGTCFGEAISRTGMVYKP